MSQDVVGAIVSILSADSGVSALVGARVYGDEIAPDEIHNQPRAAVVVQPSGGAVPTFTQGTIPLEAMRVDVLCYGSTRYDADRLRRAVYDSLRAVQRRTEGSVLVHWINLAGGLATGRDPDTGWPRAFQSWQVLADTRPAA